MRHLHNSVPRGSRERNVEVRRLAGSGETTNRSFVPYAAKVRISATYGGVKRSRIAYSVKRLTTGRTTEGSEFESR
jgi:hypothetical protein